MGRNPTLLTRGALRAASNFALLASLLVLPAAAGAQEQSSGGRDDSGFSARGAIGFTADPSTFLMTLEVPWAADELVSVGPLFQLGISDDDVLFAPSLQAYLTPRLGGDLDEIRPYAHMGMGIAYLEKDRRGPRDDEDVDFLLALGLGVEYALQENLFVGTGLLFNVIPAGVVGENFIFGWQVLGFRVAF
jgi:hypothetical protein